MVRSAVWNGVQGNWELSFVVWIELRALPKRFSVASRMVEYRQRLHIYTYIYIYTFIYCTYAYYVFMRRQCVCFSYNYVYILCCPTMWTESRKFFKYCDIFWRDFPFARNPGSSKGNWSLVRISHIKYKRPRASCKCLFFHFLLIFLHKGVSSENLKINSTRFVHWSSKQKEWVIANKRKELISWLL
jgi:hypothetical protein